MPVAFLSTRASRLVLLISGLVLSGEAFAQQAQPGGIQPSRPLKVDRPLQASGIVPATARQQAQPVVLQQHASLAPNSPMGLVPNNVRAAQAGQQATLPVADAMLCNNAFARYETLHGIPVHLLASIARQESGRWDREQRAMVAWPWTISAEGSGKYLANKEEAMEEVRKLWARGVRSIDVGCMQVNLVHHPEAFQRLSEAFDPDSNINYAATFLRGLYEESGSWRTAVGNYHSRTPSLSFNYASRVLNHWRVKMGYTPEAVPQSVASAAPANGGAAGSAYYLRRAGGAAALTTSQPPVRQAKRGEVMVIRVADNSEDTVKVMRMKATGKPQGNFVREYAEVQSEKDAQPHVAAPKVVRVGGQRKNAANASTPVDFIFE